MDYRWYDPSMDIVPRRINNERKVDAARETYKDNNPPVDNDTTDVEVAGSEVPETVPDVQIQQPVSE